MATKPRDTEEPMTRRVLRERVKLSEYAERYDEMRRDVKSLIKESPAINKQVDNDIISTANLRTLIDCFYPKHILSRKWVG